MHEPSHHGDRIAVQVADAASLELDTQQPRLLAFGSSLIHGSVGLNAANLVYQQAGIRTIQVPSIVLSVMPHYASTHHLDVSAEWITNALEDLTAIDALAEVQLVTSGYLTEPAQAVAIATWYESLDADTRPSFVLDPTLGDVELGFYTNPALTEAFRSHLLPLATGVTPNLFELSHLSGVPLDELTTETAIAEAARSMMGPHTRWVVVTGISHPEEPRTMGEVLVVDEGHRVHHHERVTTQAKGLGDTFTAALCVGLLHGHELDAAVDEAAAEVLRRTR